MYKDLLKGLGKLSVVLGLTVISLLCLNEIMERNFENVMRFSKIEELHPFPNDGIYGKGLAIFQVRTKYYQVIGVSDVSHQKVLWAQYAKCNNHPNFKQGDEFRSQSCNASDLLKLEERLGY